MDDVVPGVADRTQVVVQCPEVVGYLEDLSAAAALFEGNYYRDEVRAVLHSAAIIMGANLVSAVIALATPTEVQPQMIAHLHASQKQHPCSRSFYDLGDI
jgi:hypothetical protein